MDHASITGESIPLLRTATILPTSDVLQAKNMVFFTTDIVEGITRNRHERKAKFVFRFSFLIYYPWFLSIFLKSLVDLAQQGPEKEW